ncbi:MAG: type II toxin-antitoxin system PemK/MazF family toxin [Nostoc sp. NMS7]|uniref:type II toxin-antitoxin system PemK/MazF family toxin n=1 Tax=Nostoc sp. NMS7 TaxID=2815391 RepID=UPI0025F0BF65|nr:type II toxin-antitoxin system PemK/MazF family toxin [Nostoc sp. NMS7]MBN3952119.1 type II toxin-antitoxin system PemK/MazF family toxin [Nostoc sp. NMS7]
MRGDVYLADLNPSRGSEQAGIRPVIIVQRDRLAEFTTTSLVVPLTTNLRRALIPGGTIVIPSAEGGLTQDSVVLSYQIVVIDKQRLIRKLGTLYSNYLLMLKVVLEYTLELDNYDE